MAIVLDNNDAAIVQGIKTVGIGKKGSKSITLKLAALIKSDLDEGRVPAASKGAFFAGLLAKGVDPAESMLVADAHQIVEDISSDAPEFVKWVCHQLAQGKTLDTATAYDLGKFLFSNEQGDGARGFIASMLRVRYETQEEYAGLAQAIQETIAPSFQGAVPSGEPIVAIAEPFDGVDHAYMVTPLVGEYVQSLGYRVIHMVGRNGGPKLVMNLWDVLSHLEHTRAASNADLGSVKPRYGWIYAQQDIAPQVDRWIEIRRQTVKRPFLSTLEKFINPAKADIMISSAYHPPFGEKMLAISERAGFKGAIVIRNGIEGSCAMPLKRPARIMLTARQKDGTYKRGEINFDIEGFLGEKIDVEEQREQLSAKDNALLIKAFGMSGTSGDIWFDARVKATREAFRLGLDYLKENVYGLD